MSTYTQIIYHMVFSTKNRERTLAADKREDVYKYIWGILKNRKSHLYRIGGTEDHVHILSSLHPTVCLADLVKDVKGGTGRWANDKRVLSYPLYWQDGYGAFTCSAKEKNSLIEYIKRQEEHHRSMSFKEELRRLLTEAGVKFDEKYLV